MSKSKGKSFGLQHCWNLLEGHKKWKSRNEDGSLETGKCRNSSPDMDDDEDYMDFPGIENYRMGYSAERSGNSGNRGGNRGRQSGNSGRNDYNDSYGYSDGRMMNDGRSGSKYGKSYDRYDDARRHYHEEKDMESMKKMEESFGDILEDFGEIADDTWKDLSPEQKNKQKPKINQMIQKLQKLQQM